MRPEQRVATLKSIEQLQALSPEWKAIINNSLIDNSKLSPGSGAL